MDEWKLKTDSVATFERALQNFSNHYVRDHREAGLESIYLAEWQAPGFFLAAHEVNQVVDALMGNVEPPQSLGARPIDETGQQIDPAQGRSWSLTFVRQSKEKEWLSVSNGEARFTVSIIGGDYPMLLKIDPMMVTARPFVAAWIERCQSLWDAVPLTAHTIDTVTGGFVAPAKEKIESQYREAYTRDRAQELCDNLPDWYNESRGTDPGWTVTYISSKLLLNSTDTGRLINGLRPFTQNGMINGVPLPTDRRRKRHKP